MPSAHWDSRLMIDDAAIELCTSPYFALGFIPRREVHKLECNYDHELLLILLTHGSKYSACTTYLMLMIQTTRYPASMDLELQ